ncbi:golgin subfamily A member 6-like protein 24 [Hydractinia symbiolongicarpus]|uniref:golgin subfamily A member 6-like protein 24 n=1 Tax=Hydractinia symbiolongicarpus TaxID=13093 RepID=UPI00254CD177|nr:golgin subfamily A member 6-like protein 24 [Hydractinia symbiolongicarpus]
MLQKELANTTREARQLQEERSKDKQKLRKIKALLNAKQQKIKELEKVKDAQKEKIETKNKFKTAKQKFNHIKREENPFSHVADDDGKDKLKFEKTEDKRETFLTQQRDNTSSFPAVRNEKEECPLDSSPTQKSETLKNEIGIITKNEKVPNKDLGEFVEKLENKTRNEELENNEEIELPQETISFSNTVQSYKTTTVVRPAKSQEKERAVKLSQKEKELRGTRKSLKSHDKQLKEPLSATLMLKEEKQHLFNHVIQMENEKKSLFESKANLQLKFDELNDKYNKEVKKASKHEEDLKRLKEVEQELCEVKQEKKLVEGREKELLQELSQLTNNMKQQRERFELRLKAVNIKVEDLEKELASRKGKFKNTEKEIYSLTLEDRNMLNEADQALKFNKGFTLKQLSQDLQEESQKVKNVENKNKGCMKTIKELETKLLAKNECLDVTNKRIEELSADLKQIKMVFKKEHKEAKKVASIEADKSEDNVSNCSKQLIEIRKNLNEARKQMPKGQTSCKKDVAENTVTDLGLLNKGKCF